MFQSRNRNCRLRLLFSMTSSSVTVTTPPLPAAVPIMANAWAVTQQRLRKPHVAAQPGLHPRSTRAPPMLRLDHSVGRYSLTAGSCQRERPIALTASTARNSSGCAAARLCRTFKNSQPSAPAPTKKSLCISSFACTARPNTATCASWRLPCAVRMPIRSPSCGPCSAHAELQPLLARSQLGSQPQRS